MCQERGPAIVGEVADQPVPRHRGGDAHRDAPHQPRHAAEREEQHRPGKLLRHPGAIDELVEAILGDAPLDDELWRMGELQLAVQLPEAVAQDRGAMREIGVAAGLALRPVADVVLADHAVGAGHADQRAEIDEQALEPQRAVVGAVDEAAVHAERVAEADGDRRRGEEERQRAPGEGERSADQGRQRHRRDPQRFDRLPAHHALDGIGVVGVEHARGAEGALGPGERLVDGVGACGRESFNGE